MRANSVAENVFGYLGALFWTIQLIPQIWKSWRTKTVEGFSPWLVLFWASSAPFLGTYLIEQNVNIPLILQNQLFCALSLVSWGQCQYYGLKRSRLTCIVLTVSIAAIAAGLEVGMVYALRSSDHDGIANKRALQFFGIFSAVLLSFGLIPQYYEIWKHEEVIGISIAFMVIDMFGGIFSDLSLVFKETVDVLPAISYSLVVVMDAVVIICALILNPRANRRRKNAARLTEMRETEIPEAQDTTTSTDSPTRNEVTLVT